MARDKLIRRSGNQREIDHDADLLPRPRPQQPAPGKLTLTSSLHIPPAVQLLRALQRLQGDPETPGVTPDARRQIRYEVVVNTVLLQPSQDRVSADFAAANRIYNRYGIRIRMGSREVISAEETRAMLSRPQTRDDPRHLTRFPEGRDGQLDGSAPFYYYGRGREPSRLHKTRASDETRELLSRNRTAGRPTAYWLPADSLPGESRDGFTYDTSFFGNLRMDERGVQEGICITADATSEVFAHELWHLLARAGHEDAEGHQGTEVSPENLAYPTPVVEEGPRQGERRGTELNDAQIQRILRSEYVHPVINADAAQPSAPTGPQLRSARRRKRANDPEAAHRAAARGISGSGESLPYHDQIQRAFGAHDLSSVRAHTGGGAVEACDDLGAEAYAFGIDIAFRGSPSLHTTAHEAAHVIQQQAGVDVPQGIGAAGDRYEHHADAVADAVVRGESVESMLDSIPGGGARAQIQRQERAPAVPPANDRLGEVHSELTNRQGAAVDAYYFPGRTTEERVLIISGTHGMEHGGVEVVQNLLGILRARTTRPRRTVIVIPQLFADNVSHRQRSGEGGDPNRNLPARGDSGLAQDERDAAESGFSHAASRPREAANGGQVLPENLILITLIERFQPSRVVSVHGTRHEDKGGFYYDPQGSDTETESDRAVCERMTEGFRGNEHVRDHASSHPGYDPGHAVEAGPTGVNQRDGRSPRPYQWRASSGGTSMGRWGSGGVTDARHPSSERAPMSVITVEPPGVDAPRPRGMTAAQAANRDSDDLAAAGQADAAAQRAAENMAFAEVIEQFIIDPSDAEADRQAREEQRSREAREAEAQRTEGR